MVTYDEAATRLRERSDLDCGAGATEAQIAGAEERIGAFPPEYRQFLADFGWADFGGDSVWGLGPRSLHPSYDVVRQTLRERELGGLPAEAIAIYNNGGGDLACFRADAPTESRGAVYYFWHDDRSIELEHDSFADFLWDLLHAADEFDEDDEDGD